MTDLAAHERIILGQCLDDPVALARIAALPGRGRFIFRHDPYVRTAMSILFYLKDEGLYHPATNDRVIVHELAAENDDEEYGWWHWLDDMRGVCAQPIETHLTAVQAAYAREDAFNAALLDLLNHGEAPGEVQEGYEVPTDKAFRR